MPYIAEAMEYCDECDTSYYPSHGHTCDPVIECDSCGQEYYLSEGHECEEDGECHCSDCVGVTVSPARRAQMLRSMVIPERIR